MKRVLCLNYSDGSCCCGLWIQRPCHFMIKDEGRLSSDEAVYVGRRSMVRNVWQSHGACPRNFSDEWNRLSIEKY